MAHLLTISYGTVTVNLNGGNIRMMEQYVPRMGDGETTIDGVQLEFSGTAATDINTSIASITKALEAAVRYNRDQSGTAVYVNFQPDGYASAYSSELVPKSRADWSLTLDNDSLGTARWGGVTTPANYRVQGYLNWKRRDWWQGAWASVSIANSNGTATTGINIYNCNSGLGTAPNKQVNYFDIPAAQNTGGDLTSDFRLVLSGPGTAITASFDALYVSCNSYGTAHYFVDYYGTADASCSGGSAYPIAISKSPGTVYTTQFNYGNLFWDYGLQPLAMLTRFDSYPPANTYWQEDYGYNHTVVSEEVALDSTTQLQITNALTPLKTVNPYELNAIVRGAASGTLLMDWMMPICLNNYAKLISSTVKASPVSDTLSTWFEYRSGHPDYEAGAIYYIQDPVTNTEYYFADYGHGIEIEPNKPMRIFLAWSYGGTAVPTEYMKAVAYLRPRRRLL